MPGEKAAMAALDVRSLAIHPADIRLEFPQDKQSLSRDCHLADGTQRDVGEFAKLSIEAEGEPVATLASATCWSALRDGAAKLVARVSRQRGAWHRGRLPHGPASALGICRRRAAGADPAWLQFGRLPRLGPRAGRFPPQLVRL